MEGKKLMMDVQNRSYSNIPVQCHQYLHPVPT
jgi:hypothetical protein